MAYYRVKPKNGLSLAAQRAIIEYFAKADKLELTKVFIDETTNCPQFHRAIKYAQKHQTLLLVAQLAVLNNDVGTILMLKKKLGKRFRSCDIPINNSLSLAIAMELQARDKLLTSIITKAALQQRKAMGKHLGNVQNLTATGRALGLKKMQQNIAESSTTKKIVGMIHKCRLAGMGW